MVVLFARESKFKVVIQTVVCCCGLLFPATLFSLDLYSRRILLVVEGDPFLPLEGGHPDEEEAHEEGSV